MDMKINKTTYRIVQQYGKFRIEYLDYFFWKKMWITLTENDVRREITNLSKPDKELEFSSLEDAKEYLISMTPIYHYI